MESVRTNSVIIVFEQRPTLRKCTWRGIETDLALYKGRVAVACWTGVDPTAKIWGLNVQTVSACCKPTYARRHYRPMGELKISGNGYYEKRKYFTSYFPSSLCQSKQEASLTVRRYRNCERDVFKVILLVSRGRLHAFKICHNRIDDLKAKGPSLFTSVRHCVYKGMMQINRITDRN